MLSVFLLLLTSAVERLKYLKMTLKFIVLEYISNFVEQLDSRVLSVTQTAVDSEFVGDWFQPWNNTRGALGNMYSSRILSYENYVQFDDFFKNI